MATSPDRPEPLLPGGSKETGSPVLTKQKHFEYVTG